MAGRPPVVGLKELPCRLRVLTFILQSSKRYGLAKRSFVTVPGLCEPARNDFLRPPLKNPP